MKKILLFAALSALLLPAYVACSEKKVEHPHFQKAVQLESSGRHAEAAEEYLKELAQYPGSVGARHNLAMVFKMTGRVTEAIGQYMEAMKQGGAEDPMVRSGLGRLMIQNGSLDQGIAELRKAVELKSPDAMIYYDLGAALEKKGDAAGAVDMYDRYMSTLGPGPDRDFLAGRIAELKKPQKTK